MYKSRVKYRGRNLGIYNTRDEAINRCEEHCRTIVPPVVNPSQLSCTGTLYTIELMKDDKVVSSELYTVIVSMRK